MAEESEPPYVIWSDEHRMWWRPNRMGYTIEAPEAGVYPRSEALAICLKARDGWAPGRPPPEIPVAVADLPEGHRPAIEGVS